MPKKNKISACRKYQLKPPAKPAPLQLIKNHDGKEFFLLERNTFFAVIAISVLTLLIYFFGSDAKQLLTSVLSPLPEHAPYDGLTYPLKEVPNWVKLSESERSLSYQEIPREKFIPLPEYRTDHLSIPYETLEWGNAEHQKIRNEKITYPVPYLGNYELTGYENTGSHPAIDIKAPVGTPIYAIGNGVVIKIAVQGGGFGNHIVVQHNKFPSPENPSRTETVFSSYSHLQEILVTEMQVVTKGQLIGYSGNSGLSTTPHLHFQMDRDSAPWHPYWPFTSAEIREQGLTFFNALNAAFGIERARQNTIHPLKYIQAYAGTDHLVASAGASTEVIAPALPSPYQFIIRSLKDQFSTAEEVRLNIRLTDRSGNMLKRERFDDRIKVELRNGLGQLNRQFLSSGFFMAGETSEAIRIKNPRPGREKLILRFRNEEFSSNEFEIVDAAQVSTVSESSSSLVASLNLVPTVEEKLPEIFPLGKTYAPEALTRIPFPRLEVTLDRKSVTVGEMVHGMVQYFDASTNNIAPDANQRFFISLPKGQGELSTDVIRGDEFVDGKFLFTITPTAEISPLAIQISGANLWGFSEGLEIYVPTPSSVPAVHETEMNGTGVGTGATTVDSPVFTDIPNGHPLEQALQFLKSLGVIQGYSDGDFKPDRPVLRVEALKMIFEALQEQVNTLGAKLFPDLEENAWYLPVVEKGYAESIIRGYPDGMFRPNAEVKLAEFYKMLFLASKTDINPDIIIALPEGIKPDDWFAPYLQEAIRLNILEVNSAAVNAGKSMTRGDIAKALYLLLVRPVGIEPTS